MVTNIVTVKVRDNGTFAWLKNLPEHTNKIGKREAWNLTQYGAKMLRTVHLETAEAWKGHIRKGINAKKLSEGTYGIELTKQAMGLDRMNPHWVSLKKGRLITQWAKDRGIDARAIKVHAHPFVEAGYLRMLNRLDIVANRIANEAVK